ncbi:tyrosine-type recombinase/integrase [Desulfobacula sp.]|jgi:integrase/recombinase XerD|uniref:tyrosine-type recombinase/integrase n=1 Tax=Desulfobacula sp. TaxID=2593537 RepID=UPI001DC2F69B|nr:tyrosine-type recombinase/integrase [Desulfobacula sp.]MBT6340266.1 tyrosine-type recombinase/integrase [Desulfobacula sp.]MBT7712786.1 tyrosine-type recombinase/integrase [Deltaproteobacteria bacterium]
MRLASCVIKFFNEYLLHIKGCSPNTIKSYRDTLSLFLPFAAGYHRIKIESLKLEHLTTDLILDFLNQLESGRANTAKTRNHRLAVLKSFAKMVRFIYPEQQKLTGAILAIPQKRSQRKLIGFLYPQEIYKIFNMIRLTQKDGFRNYTLLHLLYDTGARATEIATLQLDYFDYENRTLAILGKGNRYRQLELLPKTAELVQQYIAKYRRSPNSFCKEILFVNQRGSALTRHGINRVCKKYLDQVLSSKRLTLMHPAHSFRHSCAVRMVSEGKPISEIKNRLGHSNVQSTMVYLQLDLNQKRQLQDDFIKFTRQHLVSDPKIDELIQWENKQDILEWLDSL